MTTTELPTIDAAVRILLEGIEGVEPTASTPREQLEQALSVGNFLSGGEEALVDIARDLYNGTGQWTLGTNLRHLDSQNKQLVAQAIDVYLAAVS